jgi:hypothetical protein
MKSGRMKSLSNTAKKTIELIDIYYFYGKNPTIFNKKREQNYSN